MDIVVSIITVSLNAAATIGDTLASVRKQRARFEIEHICVDGGSMDGTREIITKAAEIDSRISARFEPDRGLFDAMNKGLQLARGRYVLFLNADDFLVGDSCIDDAFKQIGDMSPLDIAHDMILGDVIMGHLGRFSVWRMRRVPRWLPRFPRIGAHPPHQGNFINRELLLRAGGFDITQTLAADTTQFYRLVYEFQATMIVTNTLVSFMRMGGASNKQLASYGRGNTEAYRFMRRYNSPLRAALAVIIKILQKAFELRIGRLDKPIFLRS